MNLVLFALMTSASFASANGFREQNRDQMFSYIFGDRGSGRCPDGYSTITDGSGCRKACDNEKISLGSEISGGHPCYMDGGKKCHQNGRNGGGASFLCRKPDSTTTTTTGTDTTELSCECKDLMSLSGFGNCKKVQKYGKFCYVKQPSECEDLLDSVTNPGEKYSRQACGDLDMFVYKLGEGDYPWTLAWKPCPAGYSKITDSSQCRKACKNLAISLGSGFTGGHPCYRDGNYGSRTCHQDGNKGQGASFVCEKFAGMTTPKGVDPKMTPEQHQTQEQGCRKLKNYCEEMLGRSGCNSPQNVEDECWVIEQDCLKLGKPVPFQEACRPLAKLTQMMWRYDIAELYSYTNQER